MSLFSKKKEATPLIDINRNEPNLIHDGHRYYVLNPYETDESSPYKLSNSRALNFSLSMINLRLFMKPDHMVNLFDKISELAMSGMNAEIVTLCGLTKERMKLKSNADLFLDLGRHVVLVDDEPNELGSTRHNILKEELLKDEVIRGFFLRLGIRCLKVIDESLETTQIEDSLNDPLQKEIEAIFQNWISMPLSLQMQKK